VNKSNKHEGKMPNIFMATVESRSIVRILVRNFGIYPGDPYKAYAIYKYSTVSGEEVYMIAYTQEDVQAMFRSPLVSDPVLIWDHAGATTEGKMLLDLTEEQHHQ
jgi:hypothetical protein